MTATQVVPPQWRVMTLADLGATCTSGSRGWASRYVEHGHLFVRITNLRRSSIRPDLSDSRRVAVDPSEPEARRTRLQIGDVLISITADIGIIGYVDATIPDPAYINQHIARVRLDPKRADSRFVAYYLASWGPQRGFVGSTDTGAKAGMNLATVARLETVVPPLPEQRAIAAALGDADDQVERLQRLIAKKQAIKQGMMQQLLTGRTRLPGFTDSWVETRFGSVGKCVRGVAYDPGQDLSAADRPFTVRLLRSNNVQDGQIDRNGLQFVHQRRVSMAQLLEPGDIVICMANGSRALVGKAAMFEAMRSEPRYTFGAFMGAFRTDSSPTSSRFVAETMRTNAFRSWLDVILSGSSINNLRPSDVEGFVAHMPKLDEQTAIAAVLDDAERDIFLLRGRLTKALAIKQGMMQELLSGRTRLPAEPAL